MLFEPEEIIKMQGLYRKVIAASDDIAIMVTISRDIENHNKLNLDFNSCIVLPNNEKNNNGVPVYEKIDNFEYFEADMEGSDDESMETLAYKIANKILPKDAQTNEIEQEKEHIIQIFNIYNNMITFYEDVDDE